MLATCIRKELLRNILSLRYALIFLLFLTLTLATTAIRTRIYNKQVAEHNATGPELDRLGGMIKEAMHAHSFGRTVEKAPNPLGIFVSGLENEMTRAFWISPGSARKPGENTVVRLGQRKLGNFSFRYPMSLDILLIINVVCSLLAIALVFDAISGERERGTLKLVLSGPVPRDVMLLAKLIAGLITLLTPLLLSWVLSVYYAMMIGNVTLSVEGLMRLAAVALLSFLYLSFFFALGMAASCWFRRSATVLGMCLLLWVGFVLAIPALVPAMVQVFAPIPPESKIALEKDAITKNMWKNEIGEIEDQMVTSGEMEEHGAPWQELVRRARLEQAKRYEKLDNYFSACVKRQLRLTPVVSRFSPSASFVYAASHFAGTGAQDFSRLLSDFQEYMREALGKWEQMEEARIEERNRRAKAAEPELVYDAYAPVWPKFNPGQASIATVVNECWMDVVVLCGATVLLFMLAFIGFMRYDAQ